MVGELRFSRCVRVCFSRVFNVCFSRQGRAETCVHNRGRENVSDQFPSRPLLLFFPFLSTTMNLSNPRRNAERPPGMSLSNAWQPFPILFLGRVLVLGFYRRSSRTRVASLARSASLRRDLPTRTFHTSFFPSCTRINVGIVVVWSRDR